MKPTAYSPDVIQTHAISEIMGKRNYNCPLQTLNLMKKQQITLMDKKEGKEQSRNTFFAE